MHWELRGFGQALDAWEEAYSPSDREKRLVLDWIADLLDDPEGSDTTVHIDQTSATRVGCAPGTTVLMRYTLNRHRARLIAHRLDTVPRSGDEF